MINEDKYIAYYFILLVHNYMDACKDHYTEWNVVNLLCQLHKYYAVYFYLKDTIPHLALIHAPFTTSEIFYSEDLSQKKLKVIP